MVRIGNFFFKYRNLVFPIFGLAIFIPSPPVFSERVFGPDYYAIPMMLGIPIALLGQVIRALTIGLKYITRGGKDKKVYADDLVTEGVFHHCRNPLYVGNILMLLGVGILSNSLYFLVVVVPLFCFIYQAIVLAEEHYLKTKFGASYEAYMKVANRWIPRVKGLGETVASMEFNWARYIINEYNTVYMLLLSIMIVVITHHPGIVNLPVKDRLTLSGIALVVISAVYLTVRYLKKSKRLHTSSS
jgi:protein-S-isoprenylcysteine O-methyltransferase Ste14